MTDVEWPPPQPDPDTEPDEPWAKEVDEDDANADPYT